MLLGKKCETSQACRACCIWSSLPAKKWSAPEISTRLAGCAAEATTRSSSDEGAYWSAEPLMKIFGMVHWARKL